MGPSPVQQNIWERHDTDNDGDRGSDDGWHVGYEVEMSGTGIDDYTDSEDDTSGTKWDSRDGSDEDRYDGYQTLPSSDGAFESGRTDDENINSVIEGGFAEVVSSGNRNVGFVGVTKPIELTEDKIEHIKKAMSTFTLPAPSWATEIDCDNELKKLIEKLKSR